MHRGRHQRNGLGSGARISRAKRHSPPSEFSSAARTIIRIRTRPVASSIRLGHHVLADAAEVRNTSLVANAPQSFRYHVDARCAWTRCCAWLAAWLEPSVVQTSTTDRRTLRASSSTQAATPHYLQKEQSGHQRVVFMRRSHRVSQHHTATDAGGFGLK